MRHETGQYRRLAVHEAAHAVVAFALGAAVDNVMIDPSGKAGKARIAYQAGNPAVVAEQSIIVAMASAHAENWVNRWVCTALDTDIDDILNHAHSSPECKCDECVSMRHLAAIVGPDASGEQLFARYRQCEAEAIRLVQEPRAWRAINELADELLLHGAVSGADATILIGKHIQAGCFYRWGTQNENT